MKKIKIYLTALLVTTAVSCTKNFSDINTNPGAFIAAEPEAVLPGIFVNTINKFELTNIKTLWEYSHLIDPAGRYNPANEGDVWTNSYVTVLGNTKQLRNLYTGNPGYTNRIAITDIWECYVYFYLVASYGPIPYSHMGDTSSQDVEYDSENAIYTSLLSRLKADAAALNVNGDKFTSDPIYGGDMTKWVKFANSLRLRIALTVQVNLPTLAASNITELMSNEATLISSDADDPKLSYGTASGSQSQYNVQLVQGSSYSTTGAPIMSDYAFTWFRSYNDPRLGAYFQQATSKPNITDTLTSTADAKHYIVSYAIPYNGTPKSYTKLSNWNFTSTPADPSGAYPLQQSTVPANYSTLQSSLTAATRPFYIMTYAEICFMKAEAALKGYGGLQTADQYYYAGINANFAFWGLTQAQATAYEAQNGIKWSTAGTGYNYDIGLFNTNLSTDNYKKIWLQQWINYFDDGAFEAWVLFRRTQAFVLPPHTNPGATAGISQPFENLPDRYNYPVANESAVNPIGYANGIQLLSVKGQDYVTTPLAFEPAYTPINWTNIPVFYDTKFVQKWYGTHIQDLTANGITYTTLSTY